MRGGHFRSAMQNAFLALVLMVGSFGPVIGEVRFQSEELTILTADKRVLVFNVELAVTPGQRARGLMDREALDRNGGMLFDFGQQRRVGMWMKNTYLPLDMLFIDQDGAIRHIHENALPLSEDIIDSEENVRFVLEINGKATRQMDISVGDRVSSQHIIRSLLP